MLILFYFIYFIYFIPCLCFQFPLCLYGRTVILGSAGKVFSDCIRDLKNVNHICQRRPFLPVASCTSRVVWRFVKRNSILCNPTWNSSVKPCFHHQTRPTLEGPRMKATPHFHLLHPLDFLTPLSHYLRWSLSSYPVPFAWVHSVYKVGHNHTARCFTSRIFPQLHLH